MTSPKPDRLKKFLAAADATATHPKRSSPTADIDAEIDRAPAMARNIVRSGNPSFRDVAVHAAKRDSAAKDAVVERQLPRAKTMEVSPPPGTGMVDKVQVKHKHKK